MEASAALDYASRPLPLYYALSQAGIAILAAHAPTRAVPRSHGLRVPRGARGVLGWVVGPAGNGMFQAVSNAVGSAGLAGEVSIGALLATLPEIAASDEIGEQFPKALALWPAVPRGVFPAIEEIGWRGYVVMALMPPHQVFTAMELHEALKGYPNAPQSLASSGVQVQDTPDGQGILVKWAALPDGSDPRPANEDSAGRRWLRPAVCGTDDLPSVLMTWWAALLGLSSLARYHPVEWVQAIDPNNKSAETVVLERGLDAAIDVLPGLILDALTLR